jgi:nucleotide-binding universal stress UspA family protein
MKILLGYNGTSEAVRAVDVALEHARAFDGSVDILISYKRGEESQIEELETAKKILEEIKTRFQEEGIECKTHLIIQGQSPGEDIVDFAKRHGVNEIVIGIRKRSRVEKLLLGSTAQYVLLEAPCPVVGVK